MKFFGGLSRKASPPKFKYILAALVVAGAAKGGGAKK